MSTHITHNNIINLSWASRAARLALGAAFILEVMLSRQSPLGLLAIWPLLSIYPIFTASVGWDPIKEVCARICLRDHLLHLSNRVRSGCYLIGFTLLFSVYFVSGAPGWLILLPLLAIYPIYMAVLGAEPVTALLNLRRTPYAPAASRLASNNVLHTLRPQAGQHGATDQRHLAA